ncbi:MAG: hypothetical protein ACOYLH_03205 [Flavobacteriales bacterium]
MDPSGGYSIHYCEFVENGLGLGRFGDGLAVLGAGVSLVNAGVSGVSLHRSMSSSASELFAEVNAASGGHGGFVVTPEHPNQPRWYDDVDATLAMFQEGDAFWMKPGTVYHSVNGYVKIKEGKQWVYLQTKDVVKPDDVAAIDSPEEPSGIAPDMTTPSAESPFIEVEIINDASQMPLSTFMSPEALDAEVEWEQFGNDLKREAVIFAELGQMMETTVNIYVEGGMLLMTAGAGGCAIRSMRYADDAVNFVDDALKYADDAVNLVDDAANGGKTIIGETMVRVEAAAARNPGSTILKMPEFSGTRDQITSQMMQYNRQWLLQQMRSGRSILDIGLDPARKIPSIFYQMEQNMIKNYLKLHPGALNVIR